LPASTNTRATFPSVLPDCSESAKIGFARAEKNPEWVPHRQLMEVDFYSFPSCLRGALESQARPARSQTSTPAAQRSQCCALEQEAEPLLDARRLFDDLN